MKRDLNPKQRRFIAEYLKDQNGTQSAIRAGYSKHTAGSQAFDLLQKPEIKAAIGAKLSQIEEKAIVDASFVLRGLREVAERCLTRKRVMEFDYEEKELVQKTDGEGLGVWEFDSAGANRALELLGKHLKMFTDKTELTADKNFTDDLADAIRRGNDAHRK